MTDLAEQRALILELSEEGCGIREISRELNISRNTVRKWIRRHADGEVLEDKRRLNHGARHISDEQVAEMRRHYLKHPSTPTSYYAKRYNVCPQTIRNHFHKIDLPASDNDT